MDKPKCWVKKMLRWLSLSTVNIFITFLNQHLGLSIYFTQIWVQTTQHFLKCIHTHMHI